LVTITDPDKTDRNVISFGKTTVTSIDYGRFTWYIVRSDEGKESGFKAQVNDPNYIEVTSNPDVFHGLIEELTKYHIMLFDHYNNRLFSYKNAQMLTKQNSEDAIIGVMRDIIIGTAKGLYDSESDYFVEPLDSGAFKGEPLGGYVDDYYR
jgi:hypothetical protein